MKLPHCIFVVLLASAMVLGADADRTATPILPTDFAGWHAQGPIGHSSDPAVADPVNGSLLQEYGFTDLDSATYVRDDGRKLTLKAARFNDASGAFGAYSYYKMPQMREEKVGEQGASLNERVLFFKGNLLVDAVFGRVSAMSGSELRELANMLPPAPGNAGKIPAWQNYLPAKSQQKNSLRYIVGPVGLQKAGAPLNADLVDFKAGAEVALANYDTAGGDAVLMVVSYPTNQIAADHMRRMDATQQPEKHDPGAPMVDVPFFDRRTGPLVVVAAGPISRSDANSLLAAVNYDADVTWNENTYMSKRDNVGNLVWNALVLCGILGGLALISGVAFGGFRMLVKYYLPGRFFDRPEKVEFISLNLEGDLSRPQDSSVSPSINAG